MDFFDIELPFKESNSRYDEYLNFKTFNNRSIFLGDINPESAYELNMLINMFNEDDTEKCLMQGERKPIRIYIDSQGGHVTSCFQIIDTIQLSKTPVWTIASGMAYSSGGLILMAGHQRFAYPHASFLWHAGSMSMSSDVGKFKNFVHFQDKLEGIHNQWVAEHTNITLEELNAKIHEDWWMTADEMLEKGIVDEITTRLV